MRKLNLNDEILNDPALMPLNQKETTEISGGGWLTSLIGAAFSLLGDWVVSLFNDGLDVTQS